MSRFQDGVRSMMRARSLAVLALMTVLIMVIALIVLKHMKSPPDNTDTVRSRGMAVEDSSRTSLLDGFEVPSHPSA